VAWHAHADRVFAYAARRCDRTLVPEVVAEVFLVAWRRRQDAPEALLPWLLGIASNVVRQQRRSAERARRRVVAVSALADLSMEDPAETAVRDSEIHEALAQLSGDDCEALLLVHWDGLSHDEAANVVGCRPGAFSVRVHRARQRLAKLLEHDDEAVPTKGSVK
jgi:RNA polymerase sigma-70 factor (ECF subfamily)